MADNKKKVSDLKPLSFTFSKHANNLHEKAVEAFNIGLKDRGISSFKVRSADIENSAVKSKQRGSGSFSIKVHFPKSVNLKKYGNDLKYAFQEYISVFFGTEFDSIKQGDFDLYSKDEDADDIYCRFIIKESTDLCRDVILSVSNKKLDIANSRLKKVIEAKIKAKVAQFK